MASKITIIIYVLVCSSFLLAHCVRFVIFTLSRKDCFETKRFERVTRTGVEFTHKFYPEIFYKSYINVIAAKLTDCETRLDHVHKRYYSAQAITGGNICASNLGPRGK